jgi:hypothetical protein
MKVFVGPLQRVVTISIPPREWSWWGERQCGIIVTKTGQEIPDEFCFRYEWTQAVTNTSKERMQIVCGYACDGVRFWHIGSDFTLVSGHEWIKHSLEKCRNS